MGNGSTLTLPAGITYGEWPPSTSVTCYYQGNGGYEWTEGSGNAAALSDGYLMVGSFTTMGELTDWVAAPGIVGGGAVAGMGGPRSGTVNPTPVSGGSMV
jgi:hypothetical protein